MAIGAAVPPSSERGVDQHPVHDWRGQQHRHAGGLCLRRLGRRRWARRCPHSRIGAATTASASGSRGENSGTEFKIILTDNGGERLATKFMDDFTGWRELRFPWQVFYHDPDFQPGGAPNDGPTLTAVEAFAFAPAPLAPAATPWTRSFSSNKLAWSSTISRPTM
jgi:hypothetical protein